MSQHDYNIANGGGAAVRADINNALLAILSQNSGATAPTTTKPFMPWYDTANGIIKIRNSADTAWLDYMNSSGQLIAPTATGLITALGGQIKFPATQNASSDANTLDDYEEGTFTPVVKGTGTMGTATYSTQQGTYIKIGKMVFVRGWLAWSSGTGTTNLYIDGLPFASAAFNPLTISYPNGLNPSASNYICNAYIEGGSTYFYIVQSVLGGGSSPAIPYDANGEFMFSGCYIANA